MSNLVGYSSEEEEAEEEIEQKSAFPPLPTVSTKRKFKLPLLEDEEETTQVSSSSSDEDENALVDQASREPEEQEEEEEEYRTLAVAQNKKKRLLDEDDSTPTFFLSSRSEQQQQSSILNFPVTQKETNKKHKQDQLSEEKIKEMVSRGESLEGVIFQQVNTDEIRTEAAYRYQQGDALFANLHKGDMITGRGTHNIRQLATVAMKQKNDKA